MKGSKKSLYERSIKRPMDFFLALIAVIILCPIFLVVALLIKIKLGSPIIFKQERPGLSDKIFKMYKFRTMTNEKDDRGELLPDHVRLTRFGKFLRSTSLDELPELINILKGEMSIVGPRPLLVQYLDLYDKHQRRRHLVRPGLTGLAQISGRNLVQWEEKFKLDVHYVDHMSFTGDLKIILLTIKKVFFKEGISSDKSTVMEPFRGTNKERIEL